MTQNEHTMLAGVLSMIIYQFIWHLILKHHPVTQKNIREWQDILKDWF